jgi:glucose/mannose-6-phosphate isomerase
MSTDPSGMLAAVHGLPEQLRRGWAAARELELALDVPRNVAVLGMGGSAIAGDLAAGLFAPNIHVPIAVLRGLPLPGWVGPGTLVIASSYSGNTAETLAGYTDARASGAGLVAISSGGVLAEWAARDGVPCLPLSPGQQPRAAVGEGLCFVLAALVAARATTDPGHALLSAAAAVEELVKADRDASGGQARALARAMVDRLPIVFAPAALGAVGRRWKTQLNENSKVAAYWEEIPELDHNALVGTQGPAAGIARIVALHAPSAGEDVRARTEVTLDLMGRAGWESTVVEAPRLGLAAEGLWLLALGDLVSVHLAGERGVDPAPVDAIVAFKARMAGAG